MEIKEKKVISEEECSGLIEPFLNRECSQELTLSELKDKVRIEYSRCILSRINYEKENLTNTSKSTSIPPGEIDVLSNIFNCIDIDKLDMSDFIEMLDDFRNSTQFTNSCLYQNISESLLKLYHSPDNFFAVVSFGHYKELRSVYQEILNAPKKMPFQIRDLYYGRNDPKEIELQHQEIEKANIFYFDSLKEEWTDVIQYSDKYSYCSFDKFVKSQVFDNKRHSNGTKLNIVDSTLKSVVSHFSKDKKIR